MNTDQRIYSSSQAELYAITRIAWAKYRDDIADFSDFRGFYKPNLYDSRIAEIKAAAGLANFQARDEPSESHRVDLVTIADTCIKCWKSLGRYIEYAYSEEQVKPKIEAAGKAYLAEASRHNWKSLMSLNTSGLNYLSLHKAELLASENMPENFEARYQTTVKDFDQVFERYISTGEDISKGTGEKIKANNQIYKDLRSMLDDAQVIFANNKAKSSAYTFEYLRSIVSVSPAAKPNTNNGGNTDQSSL